MVKAEYVILSSTKQKNTKVQNGVQFITLDSGGAGGARATPEFGGSEKG